MVGFYQISRGRVHIEFVGKTNCHFVARASPPLADGRHGQDGRATGMAVPQRWLCHGDGRATENLKIHLFS